jgi:hypothetical protein
VSGPHDFAVRIGALVSRAAASIASRSNVHDDREAPLLRAGMARAGSADLPDGESEIFFGRGLDRILVICPTGAKCPLRHRGGPVRRMDWALAKPISFNSILFLAGMKILWVQARLAASMDWRDKIPQQNRYLPLKEAAN